MLPRCSLCLDQHNAINVHQALSIDRSIYPPTFVLAWSIGVEEHCILYEYVEQRHGWESEQKRLKKELDKHGKQAAKVCDGFPSITVK